MPIGIKTASATLQRELLIMLVEETEAGEDQWLVFLYREISGCIRSTRLTIIFRGSVSPGLQGHFAELEDGVPLVFEPSIVFKARIEVGRTLLPVLGCVGQAEVLDLFGETGSFMVPIGSGADFGIVK